MKREFLEGLGLEKDAIDKIMAENGKDIEAGKAKLEEEQQACMRRLSGSKPRTPPQKTPTKSRLQQSG